MAPDLQSVLIILLYWQMKSEYLPSMQSHKDMILLITMVPAGLNGYYILSLIILPRLCTPLSSSINTKQRQHTKTNLFFPRITELHYELRGSNNSRNHHQTYSSDYRGSDCKRRFCGVLYFIVFKLCETSQGGDFTATMYNNYQKYVHCVYYHLLQNINRILKQIYQTVKMPNIKAIALIWDFARSRALILKCDRMP